jgi:hypothetical protein
MARPSINHEHRGLHGPGAEAVQGLLAGLRLAWRSFLMTWPPKLDSARSGNLIVDMRHRSDYSDNQIAQ